MSQSGYTPIYIYNSGTATNVPTSGNLGNGELAINYADGKLFYKDGSGNVQVIASKSGNVNVSSFSAGTTGFTPSTATTGAVTLSGTLATTNGGTGLTSFTANGVVYASSTSALATGSALTFDGSSLVVANGDLTIGTNGKKLYVNYIANNSGTDLNISAGNQIFSIAGSEKMRLNTSGYLGIGTSSPTNPLTVTGTANASYTSSKGIVVDYTGSSTGVVVPIGFSWSSSISTQNPYWGMGLIPVSFGSGTAALGYYIGGSEAMRIDSSGNLLVGTASSSGKVTVNSGASGSVYASSNTGQFQFYGTDGASSLGLYADNTNGNKIYWGGNDVLRFVDVSTERMRIDSSGNVGIGTSSPTNPLHVIGSILTSNTSGNAYLQALSTNNGSSAYFRSTANTIGGTAQTWYVGQNLSGSAGAFEIYDSALGGDLLNSPAGSGNLGLGVTPSAWSGATALQLLKSGNTYGDGVFYNWVAGISLNSYRSGNAWYNSYTSNPTGRFEIGNGASGAVAGFGWFYGSGGTAGASASQSQLMTLDTSGNLLVGTTSANGKLYVYKASGSTTNTYIETNTANYAAANIYSVLTGSGNNNTTAVLYAGYNITHGDVIYVYGNGNVVNVNNSYGAISDVKLKENIVDATPKLADLLKVQVRNYNLKSDPTHKQLGVVAQELEQVFPSMIDESPDKDKDGNDLGTTTKSVKYSVFVPMLIKAIQELNTLVTTQSAEIAALKQKVGI
jgi:hypothetical protein